MFLNVFMSLEEKIINATIISTKLHRYEKEVRFSFAGWVAIFSRKEATAIPKKSNSKVKSGLDNEIE